MEKKDIMNFILTNTRWYAREDVFKKLYPDEYANMQSWSFPENFKFSQRLYHYLNNDKELNLGKCRVCGKRCTFLCINDGYRNTCSNACNTKDQVRKEKSVETSMKRYGVKYPMQTNEVKERYRQTIREHYGVNSYTQTEEYKEKYKRTCLEKYGVEHYLQSEDKKEKTKATYIERYGVENNSQTEEYKEKYKRTCLEKYGVEYSSQNAEIQKRMSDGWKRKNETEIAEIVAKERATCMERYGTDSYSKTDECKQRIIDASIKKYGVEHPAQCDEVKEKIKRTNIERFGTEWYMQSDEARKKSKETSIKHFGVEHPTQSDEIKKRVRQTCLERYGVPWACMRPEARTYSAISKINLMFTKLFEKNDIVYELEFPLENYCYDFKVSDVLIEINPTITHNSYMNIFGGESKPSDYHVLKSKCAASNGYHCIHVWDWDDWDKIAAMLKPKQTLYARKLELHEVGEAECNEFLNTYHIQNTCRGQSIRLGLYMNDILVEAMTFGKPRYNKHYDYELLRLCSHSGYIVVGGAERLFKRFVEQYKPASVISYCDASKFDGRVYTRLGFTLKSVSNPSKHWWDSKQHITDNLLRQRGFDQLFNANYGKGTSNEELMLEHGFLPVYDCGQITFIYKDEKLRH